MSLELKEAINCGRVHLKTLLPELSYNSVGLQDIRLEEIERDGKNWQMTFSFPNPDYMKVESTPSPATVAIAASGNYWKLRLAKVVLIDGENGGFLALKEREAA